MKHNENLLLLGSDWAVSSSTRRAEFSLPCDFSDSDTYLVLIQLCISVGVLFFFSFFFKSCFT